MPTTLLKNDLFSGGGEIESSTIGVFKRPPSVDLRDFADSWVHLWTILQLDGNWHAPGQEFQDPSSANFSELIQENVLVKNCCEYGR
ncbi:hypothetical protein TNCT_515411 [Trichonephila clavata]|uniref:Uncharacterized protein n=1 Tax=Trichonephila clavata TaxID=2740835 RepID=A0A8X6KFD4_TRICU|nr:hypothetical protein TNCT_515411 [Trichonephila clavata]